MELQIALIGSALFQIIAFIITFSLIPKTRFNIAWISISIGFLLMGVRRVFEAIYFFRVGISDHLFTCNSWLAVVISLAMLVSSIYIRKIFDVLNRIHQLRKENEAKLLSAVISTEEKERKFFAKELHDGLGPVLSSVKMSVSAIDKIEMYNENAELLGKIEDLIDNAIACTREISNHLTPHVLERYGLKKAIEVFVRYSLIKGNFNFKITGNLNKERINYNVEVTLYRIFCELLNNTIKFANASEIKTVLNEHEDIIELRYEDNGIGFDLEAEEYIGMGLTNIKSRVIALNGYVNMRSSSADGFNALIKLPK
ncbi:MAG: histidine kinase [Bacteroidales bacterium]|nr:histidine kinase [Bacteroidales bacterium]